MAHFNELSTAKLASLKRYRRPMKDPKILGQRQQEQIVQTVRRIAEEGLRVAAATRTTS